MPAMGVTICLSSPIREFNNEDLPALGLPTIAILGNSVSSVSFSCLGNNVMTLSSNSPVPLPDIEEIQNNFSKIKSGKKAVIYYNTKNYAAQKKKVDEIDSLLKIDKRRGISDEEFKKFIPSQFSADEVFVIYMD